MKRDRLFMRGESFVVPRQFFVEAGLNLIEV